MAEITTQLTYENKPDASFVKNAQSETCVEILDENESFLPFDSNC